MFDFADGNRDQVDLLGGKGANLAEMTNLGLPVPPGFTITTEACRHYLEQGEEPQSLRVQVTMALRRLEDQLGRRLGDVQDPLLVSVRSGAKYSMPGMMETVLNVGLNDYSVKGLADAAGNERFAWDSYRRLIQMFGKTVLGISGELFEDELDAAKERAARTDVELPAEVCASSSRPSSRSCSPTAAASSRRTRASSSTWPRAPSSTRGTPNGPGSTAAASASRTTSAPR